MSDAQHQPAQPHGSPPQHPRPQHPAQPQYPGQPQYPAQPQYPGQPQHPAQQYPQTSPPAASGVSLGRAAFTVALVSLGIGLLVTLAFPILIRATSDYSSIGVISAIGNGLVLLTSIAALVLGLIAARRPGPRILAGIAIGISASSIVSILVSWGSQLIVATMY